MNAQKLAKLANLISTFYKVGIVGLTKKSHTNTTRNTQHTTTNQNNSSMLYSPVALPSIAMATSTMAPTLGTVSFPWVHARLALVVLVAPWLVPLFGMPTHTPSKNRAMGVALALSGLNLKGRHNIQASVGLSSGRDSWEVARGGWSTWGNTTPSFGMSNGETPNWWK